VMREKKMREGEGYARRNAAGQPAAGLLRGHAVALCAQRVQIPSDG
jgi:hypothetical protein